MARIRKERELKRSRITVIGEGLTERWYFEHLRTLKGYHYDCKPRFFTTNPTKRLVNSLTGCSRTAASPYASVTLTSQGQTKSAENFPDNENKIRWKQERPHLRQYAIHRVLVLLRDPSRHQTFHRHEIIVYPGCEASEVD